MAAPPPKKTRPSHKEEPAAPARAKQASHAAEPNPLTHGQRRRRPLRTLFVLMCLTLVGVLGAAPWIVSQTGLLDRFLTATMSAAGSVHVGSASLNWFSPVVLNDVEIRDAEGEMLAEIGTVVSDKKLLALACNRSDLGRFEVNRPTLHLVLRDGSSNLEDTLAKLSHTQSNSALPAAELALSDGKVAIDDTLARRKFDFEKLTLAIKLLGSSQVPLEASGSASLTNDAQAASLKFELHAQPQTDGAGSPLSAAHLVCNVTALPLTVAQPLLRRVLAEAEVNGQLTANLDYSWGGGPEHNQRSLQGEVAVTNLDLAAAALGSDRFQLVKLRVPCQLVQTGTTLQFKELAVESDIGQLAISGQATLDDLSRPDLMKTLAHEAFQLSGQLDLAQFARLLPNTLRIRAGTEITAGQLSVSVVSEPADAGGRWQARLEGSNLAGLDQGRQVAWQAPLVVDIAAHDSPQGPIIDAAHCESSFLQANAAGTLDNLTGEANFDLARLATELAQFVDLSGIQLTGSGKANFAWQRGADQTFSAQGSAEAKDLQVALGGRPAWIEQALSAQLEASGSLAGGALKQLDKVALRVVADQDRLAVELAQAIADPVNQPVPLRMTWQGPLAGWLGRLALFCDVTGWELSGDGNLSALITWSSQSIVVQESALSVDRLHAWGAGLFIDEPRLDLSAAGTHDSHTGQIDVPTATATAGTATVQVSALRCSLSPNRTAAALAGTVAYKADTGQLAHWVHDPRRPLAWNIAGQAAGQGQIKYADGIATADIESTIDGFELAGVNRQPAQAPPSRALFQSAAAVAQPAVWREQQLKVAFHAVYDRTKDLLQIAEAQIAAAALRWGLSGTVANMSGERDLDIKGEVEYDWDQLTPLLQGFVGSGIRVAGHQTSPFTLAGPCSTATTSTATSPDWQRLTGSGGFGWSQISCYGLPIGKGEIVGNLADGVVQFKPLDLEVSQGFVHINEQLRVLPGPGELRLAKGRLVDRVLVTPDVCGSALKYVVPILAEVTQAEGTFSVDIEGGRLPFGNPAASDVVGHLTTEQAQVQAGPIAQQFVLLARQVEGLLLAQDPAFDKPAAVLIALDHENIDFRLVGGRVYHRNLKFQIGGLQITTQGSVGLDDSLEMLAEVGISDALLANRPLLSSLLGRPLQIPLTGTLGKPQLDLRVVEELAGKRCVMPLGPCCKGSAANLTS